MMRHELVSTTAITVDPKHRSPKPADVKRMADSIVEVGLLSPVGLDESHKLIYGRTRLMAMLQLGNTTIPAMILDCSDIEADIAEIDENIVRTNLTALQEGKALKRRKALYEAKHPETKRGGDRKSEEIKTTHCRSDSFAADAATKTGKSKRTIERAVALAESIPDEIAALIADTPLADNTSELKKLAKLPPEKQAEVAADVKATGRGTIAKTKPKKKKPKKKTPAVVVEETAEGDAGFVQAAERWARDWLDSYKPAALAALLRIVADRVAEWKQ
jgi:ParB family chromosome partitioning protein